MADAFICDAVRTPRSAAIPAASPRSAPTTSRRAPEACRSATPAWIGSGGDVVFGCANHGGEDNRNVARMALLLAGLPASIGGSTVNRLCGSGMDAWESPARHQGRGSRPHWPARREHDPAPFVHGKSAEASAARPIFDTTIGWRFGIPDESEHGTTSMPERRRTSRRTSRSPAPTRTPSPTGRSSAPAKRKRTAASPRRSSR